MTITEQLDKLYETVIELKGNKIRDIDPDHYEINDIEYIDEHTIRGKLTDIIFLAREIMNDKAETYSIAAYSLDPSVIDFVFDYYEIEEVT